MSNVITAGALPNEWTRVGPLSEIVSIRADEQASIRVHFGNDEVPALAASFTVTQNHLPRPVMEPYHEDPTVWIMSDNADIIEIGVVYSDDLKTVALLPTHGPLAAGRVGIRYVADTLQIERLNDTPFSFAAFEMVVIDGQLPAGLTINQIGLDRNFFDITGTPTAAGDFFFTVSVGIRADFAEAYGLAKGEYARGTFSISVEAA